MVQVIKNLPANAVAAVDMGSIPGSRRLPGGGNGNPLQYSCWDNPKDREAWQAIVHRVTKSRTQLKQLRKHALLIHVAVQKKLSQQCKEIILQF